MMCLRCKSALLFGKWYLNLVSFKMLFDIIRLNLNDLAVSSGLFLHLKPSPPSRSCPRICEHRINVSLNYIEIAKRHICTCTCCKHKTYIYSTINMMNQRQTGTINACTAVRGDKQLSQYNITSIWFRSSTFLVIQTCPWLFNIARQYQFSDIHQSAIVRQSWDQYSNQDVGDWWRWRI